MTEPTTAMDELILRSNGELFRREVLVTDPVIQWQYYVEHNGHLIAAFLNRDDAELFAKAHGKATCT